MQTISDKRIYLLVDINLEEKKSAKRLAKSKGMSLQGWIGQLIKQELLANKKAE